MGIKKKAQITLKDGSSVTHTAELLKIVQTADGAFSAVAACCGKVGAVMTCQCCSGKGCPTCAGTGSIKDENTLSSSAIYDVSSKPSDELLSDIAAHVQRVADHHANTHKAKEIMEALMAGDPSPAAPPPAASDPTSSTTV